MEEAIGKIKSELGPGALILSTQKKPVRWFEKELVEVTAAIERKEEKVEAPVEEKPTYQAAAITARKLTEIFPHRKEALFDGFRPGPEAKKQVKYVDIPSETPVLNTRNLANRIRSAIPKETRETKVNETEHVSHFIKLGFSPESAESFSKKLVYEYSKVDLKKEEHFARIKAKLIQPHLKVMKLQEVFEKRNLVLIGVPGSGKTSCLVKMALMMQKQKNAKGVCFVAQDDRKLMGRQELVNVAKLLKVPSHLQFPEQAEDAKFQLIDAPALSMKTDENRTLERLCDGRFAVLILDATQRVHEMLRVLDRSHRLLPRAIVFSRLDSVSEPGAIYEVLKHTNLPLLGMSDSSSYRRMIQEYDVVSLSNLLVSSRGDV